MKQIGAQISPGGQADIRRDCERENQITAGKLTYVRSGVTCLGRSRADHAPRQ